MEEKPPVTSFITQLKKKVSYISSQELSEEGVTPPPTEENRLSDGASSRVLQMPVDQPKGIKTFASYIYEHTRQHSRLMLLRSCFLGLKDEMSSALQMKHVNEELPVPFYSWEYVIVFENPDFNNISLKGVTQSMAEEHFNLCFQGEVGDYKYQQDINRQFEQRAFLDAFQELEESDYVNQQWKYIDFSKREPRKKMNRGGFMKQEDSLWKSLSHAPKDYMTLIRNVVQTKLSLHVGLKTRLLLSASGQYIFMLLLADELDLQNEAERVSHYLQLELGATDLESMEPCDANFRPMSGVKKTGFDGLINEIKLLELKLYEEVLHMMKEEDEECEG